MEDVNSTMEQQDEQDITVWEEDELKKEAVGQWMKKDSLIDKTLTIKIIGGGTNKYKNPFITFLHEGEEFNVNISKKNKNELIDLLGSKISEWQNHDIQVTGKYWEGEIGGNTVTGAQLFFKKA